MSKFYTVEELAARWNVSTATIYQWIRKGQLKAVKLGSLVRVREEIVLEFEQTAA